MPLSEALAARRHANRPWWRRATQSIEARIPPTLRGRWALSLPAATAVALVAVIAAGAGGWYLTRSQSTVVDVSAAGAAGAASGGEGGGGGKAGEAAAPTTPTPEDDHATPRADGGARPMGAGRDGACGSRRSSSDAGASPTHWNAHATKVLPVARAREIPLPARATEVAPAGRGREVALATRAMEVAPAGPAMKVLPAARAREVLLAGTMEVAPAGRGREVPPAARATETLDVGRARSVLAAARAREILPVPRGSVAPISPAAGGLSVWPLAKLAMGLAGEGAAPLPTMSASALSARSAPKPDTAAENEAVLPAVSASAPTAEPANAPAATPIALWFRAPIARRYAQAMVHHQSCSPHAAMATNPSASAVVVDVEGKVAHPGIQTLPAGSRVFEALAAAGGALPGVDATALDLARPVTDGEQLRVGIEGAPNPVIGVPQPSAGGAARGKHAKATQPVNLNTATLEELESVPDVGPALAQRILDWRSEHGRFTSVSELRQVRGIGERKFADMRDMVTV